MATSRAVTPVKRKRSGGIRPGAGQPTQCEIYDELVRVCIRKSDHEEWKALKGGHIPDFERLDFS